MKLTYRDKMLFTGLIVAAIWALGIFFVIVPKFDDLKAANSTYKTTLKSCEKTEKTAIAQMNIKDLALKEFEKGKEVAENFYGNMITYEAENVVMELLDNASNTINISSINISQPTLVEFTKYVPSDDTDGLSFVGSNVGKDKEDDTDVTGDTPADGENPEESEEIQSASAGCFTFTISFKAESSALLSFIDKLPTSNGKISLLVDSMNVADIKAEIWEGTMELKLYFIGQVQEPNFVE